MLKALFTYGIAKTAHKVSEIPKDNYHTSNQNTTTYFQNNQMLKEMTGKSIAERRKIIKKYGYK